MRAFATADNRLSIKRLSSKAVYLRRCVWLMFGFKDSIWASFITDLVPPERPTKGSILPP